MHDYLRRIGYKPDDLNRLNVVHITGTKGKGSTSAFTERILRSHLKGGVGLYTSPHLCAVRERIRVNGEPLSEEVFAKLFFEVWEKLESDQKVSYPFHLICDIKVEELISDPIPPYTRLSNLFPIINITRFPRIYIPRCGSYSPRSRYWRFIRFNKYRP